MKCSRILAYSILIGVLFFVQPSICRELSYKTEKNIFYRNIDANGFDDYMEKMCRLDVYHPVNSPNFPTLVWFHGGGLKGGRRDLPEKLKNQGIAVVSVDYRLYPNVKCPVYIDDAAASVAWTFENIEKYGGNPDLIFISGHSAGGYLTSIIGLDKSWLSKYNVDTDKIAGLIPFSGHTITHFTIREEWGIPGTQPVIDKYAPLYHIRKDAPPLILITGDRNLEMLGRYEENAYLMRMMKVAGHKNTELYEIQGFNHGQMLNPACTILLKHIKKNSHVK